MTSLIQEQSDAYEHVQTFIRNLRKDNHIQKAKPHYWTKRISLFEELWSEIRYRHKSITAARAVDPELGKQPYFKDSIYNDIEQACLTYSIEIEDERAKFIQPVPIIHPEPVQRPATPPTPAPRHIEARLPLIELPRFNGDYKNWVHFRDTFTSLIHMKTQVSGVDKLNYLKGCLEGPAKGLLDSYTITEANYELAWEELKNSYDNSRKLIAAHIVTILDMEPVTRESATEIRRIAQTTKRSLQALQALNIPTDQWDPILVILITRRLPSETVKNWEQSLKDPKTFPKWNILQTFLEERYRTLEAVEESLQISKGSLGYSNRKPRTSHGSDSKSQQGRGQAQSLAVAASNSRKELVCALCRSTSHKLGRECKAFQSMSIDSRREFVKTVRLCFNCLGKHWLKECTSTKYCMKCNAKHHTMLHLDDGAQRSGNPKQNKAKPKGGGQGPSEGITNPPTSTSLASLSSKYSMPKESVLLGTISLLASFKGKVCTLRALIDTASQASFITEKACKKLRAQTRKIHTQITGIGNSRTNVATQETSIRIAPQQTSGKVLEVKCLVIPEIIDNIPMEQVHRTKFKSFNDLQLADPHYDKPGNVDLLLGADIYGEIITGKILKGNSTTPTAIESLFGWILIGRTTSKEEITSQIHSLISCVPLNEQLRKFWELEEVDYTPTISPDDIACEKHFKETHKRDSEGRYTVQLPWKPSEPNLGNSRHIALKRYIRVEQSLKQRGEFENYCEILKEYHDLGHLEKVDPPPENEVVNHCYLPHHAVFKEESLTTRLRVVFDASCHTSNGKSLNDSLYVGPKLQTELVDILIKWRFFQYVITADITKMYRQILVDPQHQEYQRILVRLTPQSQIQDYKINRVTFGVNCAPYLAIRVLHQLSDDEGSKFPLAAKAIKSDMYVDDVLTGAHSLEGAKIIQQELIRLFELGKFDLRKWGSNHPDLLKHLPEDYVNPKLQLSFEQCNVKTLGISWEPNTDLFMFQPKANNFQDSIITKRKVLSLIAQIYDPLGWLSPCLIKYKIFMQQLWLERLDWDDPLPIHLSKKWSNYASDYRNLEKVNLPRWNHYDATSKLELHGFSDASEGAYAAVIYSKVITSNGNSKVTLLISKTKVAPVKTVSLPRLELCGALILSRLMTRVQKVINIKTNIYLWTDSTIVLHWITRLPNTLKCFVANRVSEIQVSTSECHWRHVRSKDNPADLASRGINTIELIENSLWWSGPPWLKDEPTQWPKPTPIPQHNLDVRPKSFKCLIAVDTSDIFKRFSSFSRMIRVIAFVRRAYTPALRTQDQVLTANEIQDSQNLLIQLTQNHYYKEEIQCLTNKEEIPSNSVLKAFNSFLDDSNILRSKSRLLHANLPYSERCPIILPTKAHFTKLYVQEIHKLTLHGRQQLMIGIIRRKYWIPRLIPLVKLIINHCVTCVRFKKEVQSQIMAPLPSERTDARQCFTNVGMDYCGPFTHKLYEGRCPRTSKCYALVIVCFVSRMIHLELVSDLTTEAFLAAFERFISRRSLPKTIFCDNATYFVGAEKELKKQLRKSIQEATKRAAEVWATKGVQFHFSPPSAPHFNGMAEAGVKSIKYHLKRVMGNQLFTFEKFCTILTKIEACLNSRPLAPMSDDPEDITALTPAHLWMGRDLAAVPEEELTNTQISPTKFWKITSQIRQHFWTRWSQEYLHQLKSRHKWPTHNADQEVGQLVIIKNELLPPQQWKLGRIIAVHPGKDGAVRVVTIKCESGEYVRPITKLVLLPQLEGETAE